MSVNLLDTNFYRAANSDLRGLSDTQARSHFQNYGLNEGRSFSPFINLNYYRASNSDLAGFSDRQAYEHLSNYGIREGRRFSSLVDLNFYRSNYNDLASLSNEQLFEHLGSWGVNEGRRFSEFVDFNVYAAANLDLAQLGWNNTQLLAHLVIYGVAEGRRFSVAFDSQYYRSTYSDLAQAGLSNTQLLEHFQKHGLNEGRASSEAFNVRYYLDNNSDLRTVGFDNLQAHRHFEIYGFREGRLGNPSGQIFLSTDPGNGTSSAFNFGVLNGIRIVQEFVGSNDGGDYYRFIQTNTSNFSLSLNNFSSDINVELLDSNGSMIVGSYNSDTTAETISWQLNSGTYYIRVYPGFGANTNYNLTVSATSTSRPLSVFNSVDGYGLVDAASAVAKAIGQTPFAYLADLGGDNWGNDILNVPEVWARGYTGQGIIVAAIDDGLDINHEDLRGNIWRNPREIASNGIDDDRNGYVDDINGWNFAVNNNNVLPSGGHGTHVAGTIAAQNNGFGITGVAYNAKIMPLRLTDEQDILNGDLARAIRYAVDNGARVINLSLISTDFPELRDALAYAASRNVITVSAAGNSGLDTPNPPAIYATEYGISVGSADNNRQIAELSNFAGYDSRIKYVIAPGVGIVSTTPNNTYSYATGTSMATAHVSGIVALMLSANPNLTHTQVRDILTSSAIHVV
ncbi:MAG: S8 family peptidase [Scytonema sp. PMC 1069.18]|nr:S8 family peptidase [Scytonema sp. PMC 1069.18]MEC4879752.1 S8 family peptidase [Scytonema sp. PMC 1070.18]